MSLVVFCLGLVACHIDGAPCGWFNMDACVPPPTTCAPMGDGGAGGYDGVGGYGGAGGSDGVGGDTSTSADVGAGTGTSSGAGGSDTSSTADVGAGAGAGPSAARPAPRPARRRHRGRERLGTAAQADCPAPMWAPTAPALVPFNTTDLRRIAAAQGIGSGQSGIQLNRTIGLAFENWVLVTLGQKNNRSTKPMLSPERKKANNGGLPASVIPEYVSDLFLLVGGWGMTGYPESQLWEVKAVTGTLTLSSSRYQILGLVDVARLSAAGTSTDPKHPPPAVMFTTTANTIIGQDVLAQATQWGVAIWQEEVWYDLNTNPNNPDLYIREANALNPNVYGTVAAPAPGAWPHSPLTSPPTPPILVPGDPDPPEVD